MEAGQAAASPRPAPAVACGAAALCAGAVPPAAHLGSQLLRQRLAPGAQRAQRPAQPAEVLGRVVPRAAARHRRQQLRHHRRRAALQLHQAAHHAGQLHRAQRARQRAGQLGQVRDERVALPLQALLHRQRLAELDPPVPGGAGAQGAGWAGGRAGARAAAGRRRSRQRWLRADGGGERRGHRWRCSSAPGEHDTQVAAVQLAQVLLRQL
jgi:hypothetical protein